MQAISFERPFVSGIPGYIDNAVRKQFMHLLARELVKTSLRSSRGGPDSPGLFPSGVQGDLLMDMLSDILAQKVADASYQMGAGRKGAL